MKEDSLSRSILLKLEACEDLEKASKAVVERIIQETEDSV